MTFVTKMRTAIVALLAIALLGSGKQAKAQLDGGIFAPLFAVNSGWSGAAQSLLTPTLRGVSRLLITSDQGNRFGGYFLFNSHSYPFQGVINTDGSLALTGSYGFSGRGMVEMLSDGGFEASFSYMIAGGDMGMAEMLHIYAAPATFQAFPPGPCTGLYTDSTGVSAPMSLQRGAPSTDGHTTEFSGQLTMGRLLYYVVGTISTTPNRDGSLDFELIGLLSQPGGILPCIDVLGVYLPAGGGLPGLFSGQYEQDDIYGNELGEGAFSMTGG